MSLIYLWICPSTYRVHHLGNITIDEEKYSVNQEFQESTTVLADTLDLDELDSARLLLGSQEDAKILDRSSVALAVIHFHERRGFLLECLRLLLKQSTDPDCEEDIRDVSRQLIGLILETKDGPARNGSLYVQKCFRAMADIEKWLQALEERHQGALALGQTLPPEANEIIGAQQLSLGQQHESLGAIVNHLIKANHTGIEDFYKLMAHLPRLDKWNDIAVHYIPMITAFTSQFGSPEGGATLPEVRSLNTRILESKEKAPWSLRNLQAATITWWLAEYSGWYLEQPTGSEIQRLDLEAEARARSDAFFEALQDGAFQCILSICSQVMPNEWYDPARNGLIQLLLHDSVPLHHDLALTSPYFQTLLMEQLEIFVDAFITNMPDTLRRFKVEEDDQRKRIRSALQPNVPGGVSEQAFHLERFLLTTSFSFDHRAEAAQAFWSDVDSNLYGFLQWASKRQSTPCVGAFCEMLRSISHGEDCAASAHRFLLEESTTTSAKIRRSTSLSWAQIFDELNVYTSKLREQPAGLRQATQYGGNSNSDDIVEPESPYMLESYMRLMSHLCDESAEVRLWLLSQSNFPILEVLFQLCHSSVPNRLHACAFTVIRALLTGKTTELGMSVWTSLDQWISGRQSPPLNVSKNVANTPARTEQATFEAIAGDFEQAKDFICLLQSLLCPAIQDTGLNDQLSFPENLGSAYRMPGIEPYIDFVFDRVFASTMTRPEELLHHRILTCEILTLTALCLDTFNEDLVVLANRSTISVDEAMNTSSLLAYVRLHPFARVMEWMFNERVLAALFAAAHQDIDEVSSASSESPLILSLCRSIEVMNLIMDLQSTYLDIVRPLIKLQSTGRKQPVLNPSLASFEDSVALNLGLVADLGLYSGVGNQHLTVVSLKLLGNLASSRKLNIQSNAAYGQRVHGNRLISAIEQHDDLDRIARSLRLAMNFDSRELDQGVDALGWTVKSVILDFLVQCLITTPDKPTLAHALLGFACRGMTLDVEEGSLFANSLSLFHAVLRLVIDYPNGDDGVMQTWSLSLKQKAMQVLSILWTSSLTSIFTLSDLRASDFLFELFPRQVTIGSSTVWDGRSTKESEFMYTESAEALEQYLWHRRSLLEYTATEIRLVAVEGVPSLKARIFSTLLGSTSMPDGEQAANPTIFDLLDFIELDISHNIPTPRLKFFSGLDFTAATGADFQRTTALSDMKLIHETITLRLNELRRSGHLQDPNEEQHVNEEAEHILLYFQSENNRLKLTSAKSQTTKAWADLLILAVGTCDLDSGSKAALILQALQLVTPKLEEYAVTNVPAAIDITKLILALLFQLDFESSALDRSRAGDVANDRLFQVFRVALRAINCPEVDVQLREILYKVCYRYLTGMAQASNDPLRRRHSTQTLKSMGERTMDIICDDAYGASGSCQISALLLLDALGRLATMDNSNYIIDSLTRTNFIQVLVESIEKIPQELRETHGKGERSGGAAV